LSRRYLVLYVFESKAVGFELVKGMYANDEDFKKIFEKCSNHAYELFHVDEGFLFKGPQLCVLNSEFNELLIQELHEEALA